MHPFFLPIPTFLLAGLAYPALAALMGARRPVEDGVRRDVDAVETRIAELSEGVKEAPCPVRGNRPGLVRVLPPFALAGMVALAVLAACGRISAEAFKGLAFPLTLVYFGLSAVAELGGAVRRPAATIGGKGNETD